MSSPLISIIIPSYNQGMFIRNTLQSIVNQQYANWEVIIQDGGSTDQTKEIAESFLATDKRIFFKSEKDRGFSDAVNKALVRCKGKFAIIQNSDDFFSSPDVFTSALNYFNRFPDLYLLSARFKRVDEQFRELLMQGHEKLQIGFIKPFDVYSLRSTFGQSSTFFSVDRIREIGMLSLNVDMVADTDTWIRIANYHPAGDDRIYFADETWSCATFHNEQRSVNQSKFMIGRALMYTDLYFNSRLTVAEEEKKKIALLFVKDAFEYLIERNQPTNEVEEMYRRITGEAISIKKKIKKNIFQLPGMRNLIKGEIQKDGTSLMLSLPRGENAKWFI